MKKPLIASAIGFIVCMGAYAQTNVRIHSGTSASCYPVAEVREILFDNDGITVVTTDGEFPFGFESFDHIDFGKPLTSSAVVSPENPDRTLVFADDCIVSAVPAEIVVYNAMGQCVGIFSDRADISGLAPGIYIATANGATIKFLKK